MHAIPQAPPSWMVRQAKDDRTIKRVNGHRKRYELNAGYLGYKTTNSIDEECVTGDPNIFYSCSFNTFMIS